MTVKTIIGFVGGRVKTAVEEQAGWERRPPSLAEIRNRIDVQLRALWALVDCKDDRWSFQDVETQLIPLVLGLGRLFLAYFLCLRDQCSTEEAQRSLTEGRLLRKARKHLGTYFGRVTYWRKCVRGSDGRNIHPLDTVLGLAADGFSFHVMEMCARLSTLLSYEQVTAFLLYFLGWSPSKTTVERAVLGFGRYTQDWFAQAPAPEGDGEVLVIQIDSKATPTATDEELERRRGPRSKKGAAPSPRHRGRLKRARRERRRRRKGDKSKNGKMATIVTMYTLKPERRNGKQLLLGPINKRVYASYGPRAHAIAVARREADRRGFPIGCNKIVQVVTDGDIVLEQGVAAHFPGAIHTLDIFHVLEYVWEAGRLIYREGTASLAAWVKKQETLLYSGEPALVIQHVAELIPKANKRATKRLTSIRDYLLFRLRLLNYKEMREQDLELASGMVEGAVRHVIAKRMDNGSMRWIRERAQALLQLRCIEINGDWKAFTAFVAARLQADAETGPIGKLLTPHAQSLPGDCAA